MDFSKYLSNFNISELNDMQKASIDAILKPTDVVLVSPTGSGKTLAYLLPALKLLKKDVDGVQVLILVPSRELAIQIEKVFKQMSTGYKINCCYGGHAVGVEENNLSHPPEVLVGTPGRIAHHIRRKNLDLDQTHLLILDEFDKSLEFGFKDDMDFIIKQCQHLRKRVLTSATELKEIPNFVGLKRHVVLNYTTEHPQMKSALVIKSVRVKGDDKLEGLMLLLGKLTAKSTIVFCNHREAVDRISEQLKIHKVDHGFYHGGMNQIDREKTMIKLRNGSINLMITTDLAARGIDIPEIEAVIHYQLPTTKDVMIHRNGRTARMNARGTVYFLLNVEDHLPKFLTITPEEEELPTELVLPKPCEWKTLYIAAGKKDKVNKMDIVGMLLKKGNLEKDDVGLIEVLDHSAYVAIKANKIKKALQNIKEEKIKNRKIKMEISS